MATTYTQPPLVSLIGSVVFQCDDPEGVKDYLESCGYGWLPSEQPGELCRLTHYGALIIIGRGGRIECRSTQQGTIRALLALVEGGA